MHREGIGLVHLHSVSNACRQRLAVARNAATVPYVITLHDLLFINPHAFEALGRPVADVEWVAGLKSTFDDAAAVIAPSLFIRDAAHRAFPGVRIDIIEPGIEVSTFAKPSTTLGPPADFAAAAPRQVIAVVGAIGPHKGSGVLDALAAQFEGSDVGIVVIGYVDSHLTRGWVVPGRYYVHGPYRDRELPQLLSSYGVRVGLFPNRLPEAFSYTLSELWAARVPVVVPDEGALGERVSALGGGWKLPSNYDASAIASFLLRLLSTQGASELARVQSEISSRDVRLAPALTAMADSINALYDRFSAHAPSAARDDAAAALAPLLAANLDGFRFRDELVALTNEITQTRDWMAKLERDIATLNTEIARLAEDNRRLADDKAAFDLLPEVLRKFLLRRVFRARS